MIPGKVENEAGYCHESGKEKHAILFPNMLREKGEDQCAYNHTNQINQVQHSHITQAAPVIYTIIIIEIAFQHHT